MKKSSSESEFAGEFQPTTLKEVFDHFNPTNPEAKGRLPQTADLRYSTEENGDVEILDLYDQAPGFRDPHTHVLNVRKNGSFDVAIPQKNTNWWMHNEQHPLVQALCYVRDRHEND